MTLYYRATLPNKKTARRIDPDRIVALDVDDDATCRLVTADGLLVETDGAGMAEAIAGMPRHSIVWVDPGTRSDVVTQLQRAGILDDLVAAGWVAQPCISNGEAVAVWLKPSAAAKETRVRIQSLRIWERDAPRPPLWHDRVRTLVNRAEALTGALHERLGVRPGVTPAATAFDAWRRTIDRPYFRPTKIALEHMRAAFFGGIVASSKRELRDVRQYDMRGAYAWSLRQGVPIGPAAYTVKEYPRDVPGVYRVRAILNPAYPSPFMVRSQRYGAGTSSSTGTPLETWATSEDIALARSWGGTVEVESGWVWLEGIGYPFGDFVGRVAGLERATGVLRTGAKAMRNSLYGRFARSAVHDSVVFSREPPDDSQYHRYYGMRGPVEGMWIAKGVESPTTGVMPHWAVWVTAAVRRRLLEAWVSLLRSGAEVYYADTDCLITDGYLETGTDYGDWRIVHYYRRFAVFASKRYVGLTEGDEVVVAWSGVPTDERARQVERFKADRGFATKPTKPP